MVKRVRRTGHFFSNGWGNSTGKPRAQIDVRIEDGPDAGRLVHIEMKAGQLARYIASLSDTLENMRRDASRKTAVMTEDGELHGADPEGRPLCERLPMGPVEYVGERVTCALCLDVILNS